MEKKTAALLVLALVASIVVTAAYAMGRQTAAAAGTGYNSNSGYGMGPSVMGGHGGYRGGMTGLRNGPSYMYQYMQEHRSYCWNATAVP